MRYILALILLCSGLLVETADSAGVHERESLRGLSGVFVVVDELDPEGTKRGLSVESIFLPWNVVFGQVEYKCSPNKKAPRAFQQQFSQSRPHL